MLFNIRQFINEVFDTSGTLFVNESNNKEYLPNKITDLSFSIQTLLMPFHSLLAIVSLSMKAKSIGKS